MTTLKEGSLIFDFSRAETARRLHERGEPFPVGFCDVDFIVDHDGQRWLIEVKDPDDPGATDDSKKKFYEKLKGKELIDQSLVPKCRDSYTFLHLMAQDDREFLYIVLIAIEDNNPVTQYLGPLRDRLLSRLRKEAKAPWVRHYVKDCIVLTVDKWNEAFPFPVTRVT